MAYSYLRWVYTWCHNIYINLNMENLAWDIHLVFPSLLCFLVFLNLLTNVNPGVSGGRWFSDANFGCSPKASQVALRRAFSFYQKTSTRRTYLDDPTTIRSEKNYVKTYGKLSISLFILSWYRRNVKPIYLNTPHPQRCSQHAMQYLG